MSDWDSYLVTEKSRFLDHHPHLGRQIRDAVDFEGTLVPLAHESIWLFEFAPEVDRSGRGVADDG